MSYVQVKVKDDACNRTKERFNRFSKQTHRIKLLRMKNNESLTGDGFIMGEPISMFMIQTFDAEQNLWANAWEGWIPDNEIIISNASNNKVNLK